MSNMDSAMFKKLEQGLDITNQSLEGNIDKVNYINKERPKDKLNPFSVGYKGLTIRNYIKGQFYTDLYRKTAIEYAEKVNADTISIVFNSYQSSTKSSDIEYHSDSTRWWTTFQEVKDYCIYIKSLGYKVMLKPHVEPTTDADNPDRTGYIPRDEIRPTDVGAWFDSYTKWILPYAELAEELDIEVFCIGCEYKGLTELRSPNGEAKDNTAYWVKLIDDIRNVYSGPLTYASFHTANYYEESAWVTFWDKLDFIGLDFYVNAKDYTITTYDAMKLKFYDDADHSNSLTGVEYIQEKYKKPIIFTEYGRTNNNSTDNYPSQAYWADVVLGAFADKEYLSGAFWWAFESVESMRNDQIPIDNEELIEVFNKYYKLIGNGNRKNEGNFITPKNTSTTAAWFNFASFSLLGNYTDSSYSFYFERKQVNSGTTYRGILHARFGATNANPTTYNITELRLEGNSNLTETDFGYVLNGDTVDLYVKLRSTFPQFIYRVVSSDGKESNLNIKLFSRYNSTVPESSVTPTPATVDRVVTTLGMSVSGAINAIKFPNQTMLVPVLYEGTMTNGALDVIVTLPVNVPYKIGMHVNVKQVNSGNVLDVNAWVMDTANANQVRLVAKHSSGTGSWYGQYQIMVFGK